LNASKILNFLLLMFVVPLSVYSCSAFSTRIAIYMNKSTFSYGPAKLDLYPFANETNAPVVIYIHGSRLSRSNRRHVSFQPDFYNRIGWSFISIDYRNGSKSTFETQRDDVVAAINWVRNTSKALNLDPSRIVISGESKGCDLAALAAFDGTTGPLKGLICFDGLAFDLGYLAKQNSGKLHPSWEEEFGSDPMRWAKLSPSNYINNERCIPTLLAWYGKNSYSSVSEKFVEKLAEAKCSYSTLNYRNTRRKGGTYTNRLGTFRGREESVAITKFMKSLN
jgi:acetyl esterase/lipase